MYKRSYLTLFFLTFIFSFSLFAQTPAEPSGRRLRDIVRDKYPDNSVLIGATTGAWAFGKNTCLVMDREFSYVTPENDFKQWNIHPDPNTWNWQQTDDWADHIDEYDQVLRMHGPIGPQCSNWAQTDSRTANELEQLMRDFMQAVCARYNGVPGIISIDVVNETVQGGSWKRDEAGTGGWEMPWYKIGLDSDIKQTPLYIRYAFEIANAYAPNLKLIYNHHESPSSTSSWSLIKTTIKYLRDLGLRVDGIGWQAHVENGWATTSNLNNLRNLIVWAHNNDLEFHVTEASVWIDGNQTESAFQLQADTYQAILNALLEKRSTGIVGWNTWHIDDASGWQNERVPSLFDQNCEAKPAYYAIQDALENPLSEIKEGGGPLQKFRLIYNYPNPFNPLTNIVFEIPDHSNIYLVIYNQIGQRVRTLFKDYLPSGHHSISWDSKNDRGEMVPSGIYIYQLDTEQGRQSGKMILLK